MKAFFAKAVIASLLCCLSSPSYARPANDPTYARLVEQSDLVVVVNAFETSAVPNTEPLPNAGFRLNGRSMAPLFQQVETTFRVQAVAKGQFAEQRVVLVHFRWKTPDELRKEGESFEFDFIRNGPILVEFPNQFFNEMLGKTVKEGPDCLLFLKLRKDGKCEPITDQVDPGNSVRWLSQRLKEQQ